LHTDKSIVAFQLLDMECEKITFDKLTENINPEVPNGVNNCGICAKPIVKNQGGYKDQREIDGQLRCFDHIGMEAP